MAMHHVVLILSVCRVWHFNLCSVKRKGEKKKRGGRKEGVYNWEGRGQRGLGSQVGLQNRAQITLCPTALCAVAESPNGDFSRFPHTLVRERNYCCSFRFREGRTMCLSGGQCCLSQTADRRGSQRNEEYDRLMKKFIKVSASSRKSLNRCSFLLQTRLKQPGLFLQMHSFSKIYYSKLFSGTNKTYGTVQLQA